ncbi:kelch-like protein 38 [Callorhinchus milii]|nr:kelch-like protein 38 [Callorhinchus milii]XP_007898754.1 kelch-like protein 38 [Callorhinchus milii]XP_042188488.1 kelch-like protein 38 [Callorhinchus milii]|eukprot:gi/632965161/ref/XP_007898753.1/ PREDICTED: kelch-like protein 38 [Callorhinchus milii]
MDEDGQYTDLHDYFHFKEDLSCDLLEQLNSLRQESSLTDVLLCAGGKEIPCHRNVLASSSPYFRAMFCSNFKERLQSRIHLLGICVDVLGQIVDYAYTGEIIINGGNVLSLMEAADIYQYPKVLEACSLYLQNHLTPENCFSMARLGEVFNCESLYKQARAVTLQNFPQASASEDMKELSCSELAGYLGADELCAEEEQVFETLTVWINHDPKTRQGCIHKLFQKVRLQYVHPTYLFHFMLNNPLIQSSPVCRSILESASRLLFSLSPADTPDIKPMWYVPRRYASQEFLIIVGGRKDNQQMRETLLYDQSSQQWLGLAKLPVRLYKASSASLHSNVYVLGGLLINNKKRSLSASVYCFSLKTNAWRTAEEMLVPCYSHQSIAHKNCIFSLGGVSSNQMMLNTLQRYDSIFSIWENMAPMPVAVLHPAIAAKDQRLYVFGGEDIMQNPVRLIQIYNISRNMWFRMETRMVKNICAPAAVIGDKIIIAGGYTRRMIAFDTKTSKFLKCAGMKERRMHHGATVINNKIYVTGGRYITTGNSIEDSDSFDCYDPELDTWTSKGSLPHKLFDHGCLTLQSVSYKPHTL